ncbi:MAG: TIGR00730 family Rossman fold protein [Ignavibacteriales bacterium]|nr:MAG: TIGR00730 family Rossman fold protein [Ignavibacteriales bacterium]
MAEEKKKLKAYESLEFLHSPDARLIRIMSEYVEPEARFRKLNVWDTIVFFGSARLLPRKDALKNYNKIKSSDPKSTPNFAEQLRKSQVLLDMSKYYEDAVELSLRITRWSIDLGLDEKRFIVCTGGGPGLMEAANKGAKAAGGYSVGLNISLPFEQSGNKYVTQQLSFDFHYFFMRKFWFAYLAKALVAFPGGFGTMDELFEILTLVQTLKIKKKLSIVVYDEKYWKSLVNWDTLVEHGMINKEDLDLFKFCNTVDEAYDVITKHLEKYYLKRRRAESPISL